MSEREIKIGFDRQRGIHHEIEEALTEKAAQLLSKHKALEEGIEHQFHDIELALDRARKGLSKRLSVIEREIDFEVSRAKTPVRRGLNCTKSTEQSTDRVIRAQAKEIEKLKKQLEQAQQMAVTTQLELDTPSTDPRAATHPCS